jgi:hypothetical protein
MTDAAIVDLDEHITRADRAALDGEGSQTRPGGGGDVAVAYASRREFENAAAALGAFKEWKDGVPRAAYRGCVTLRLHGGRTRVFLVPAAYLAEARAAVAAAPARKRKKGKAARLAAGMREPLQRASGGE